MIFFARDSECVSAFNKILFWLCILFSVLCGFAFFSLFASKEADAALAAGGSLMSLSMLLCAVGMLVMLRGNRVGGYATIGYAVLLMINGVLLCIAAPGKEIENLAGMGLLCLWPTLATLFGEKRAYQTEISLKQELSLRGSILGKVLFGLLYLLALATAVVGILLLCK